MVMIFPCLFLINYEFLSKIIVYNLGCQQVPDEILENLTSKLGRSVVDLKEKIYKCRKCR